MNAKTFENFTAAAHAAGFDEVLERRWAPNMELDVHTHNFDAEAVVTQGEMWLTCDGVTRHLSDGDTFTIGRQVPHSERYSGTKINFSLIGSLPLDGGGLGRG